MSRKNLFRAVATLVVVAVPLQSESQAQFSTVSPTFLDLLLPNGVVTEEPVSLTVHPLLIRPYQVDVVASDPNPLVVNLDGIQINGGGGDTTLFDIRFTGDGMGYNFDLQFIDTEFGGVLDTIPVTIRAPEPSSLLLAILAFLTLLTLGRRRT